MGTFVSKPYSMKEYGILHQGSSPAVRFSSQLGFESASNLLERGIILRNLQRRS